MCLFLVTSTIGPVSECFIAEWARIWTQTRMQDQMILQRFRTLILTSTVITFVLFLIAVNDKMHFECPLRIQRQSTVRTDIGSCVMDIFVRF